MSNFSVYWKAALMVLATVAAALVPALGDNVVSATEWVNVALLGLGAAGVFAAPNVPGAKYTKAILAFLTGAAVVLQSAIIGGVTTGEWLQILVAALAAVGVYAKKNSLQPGPPPSTTQGVV